jgi:hypothetical protein
MIDQSEDQDPILLKLLVDDPKIINLELRIPVLEVDFSTMGNRFFQVKN